jgi:hypothetical protein
MATTYVGSNAMYGNGGITINVPAGTVEGDLLVATCKTSSTTPMGAPSGWTTVRSATSQPYTATMTLQVRLAPASPPATYTWSSSGPQWVNLATYRGLGLPSSANTANTGSGAISTGGSLVVPAGGAIIRGWTWNEGYANSTVSFTSSTVRRNTFSAGMNYGVADRINLAAATYAAETMSADLTGAYGTNVVSIVMPPSNAAPFAPTWTAPADNSYQNRDASLLLDWDFTDGDAGDSQSAYALSKSVDGATLEYWNASTSAWVAAEVKNPTATTSATLPTSWAVDGESVLFAAKTWDAADAAGPYGSGLTINAVTATVPVLDSPATSAVLAGSSAVIGWTVAAQAAYQVRVLSSADAELYSTGKVTGAVTEITLGYVFSDGATGLKVELTTWNAFDVPGVDTNTGIAVSFTPPATPVLTVTANAAGYMSVAIADPTPAGSQPTVVTHDVFVRVAAGGRQVGERPVGPSDGIRISTGTVATNGTYLDYGAAGNTDFEYRTLARAGGATAYSEWS